jgi:nicotinate phosphoribosyltransferase
VRRFFADGAPVGDVIYDTLSGCPDTPTLIDPMNATYRKTLSGEHVDLLEPQLRQGKRISSPPTPADARERAVSQLAALPPAHRRFLNPHRFPVGLEASLWQRRHELVLAARA